jgi:phospholipase C
MSIARRDFLRGLAGTSGMVMAGRDVPNRAADRRRLPHPFLSGLERIVVVMMENRSFDHLLGWLPNSDGRQRGLRYADAAGTIHRTHSLAPNYTACGHEDPDHSYDGGRRQYRDGAMDGFLSGGDDDYPAGYYRERDRPFFSALARHFTTLDRSFCSILGPTFPNRLFLHSAQTDRLSNTLAFTTLPTIWDRLAKAGVSHGYYYANIPVLGLWGLKYLLCSRPYAQFLVDAAAGALPAVSFVEPRLTVADNGLGNDDHPHADIRNGDAFLSRTFHALSHSATWASTALIVTYDEWGGFFDHVAPPRATAPNQVDSDVVAGRSLLGFRVPTLVASPWTRGTPLYPRVDSHVSDHTSILKLIEWRWGLEPLTARDASDEVQNLADVFDFDRPDAGVPLLPYSAPVAAESCVTKHERELATNPLEREHDWAALVNSGRLVGWPIDQADGY